MAEAEQEQDAASGPRGESLAGALSYCHNCTPAQNEVAATSWREDRAAGAFEARLYLGGTLIEVKPKKRADADDIERVGAVRRAVREDSKRRQVKDDGDDETEQGKRGKVGAFSAKARRRLHLLLGKIDVSAPALFLTLTVSDGVPHDGRSMKLYLRRFKARLARKFPKVGMVWRLEVVPRKSGRFAGQAAGHYHCLLWGVPAAPGLHEWIRAAWSGSVGDLSRVAVEVPRNSRRVMAYASKLYMSKEGDELLLDEIGRHWGTLGQGDDGRAATIPFAQVEVRALSFREAHRLLRALRAWVKADRRSHGRRGKVPYLQKWRAYFVPDVVFWADRVSGLIV